MEAKTIGVVAAIIGGGVLGWVTTLITIGRKVGSMETMITEDHDKLKEHEKRIDEIEKGIGDKITKFEKDFGKRMLSLEREMRSMFLNANGDPKFITITALDKHCDKNHSQFTIQAKSIEEAVNKHGDKIDTLAETVSKLTLTIAVLQSKEKEESK